MPKTQRPRVIVEICEDGSVEIGYAKAGVGVPIVAVVDWATIVEAARGDWELDPMPRWVVANMLKRYRGDDTNRNLLLQALGRPEQKTE